MLNVRYVVAALVPQDERNAGHVANVTSASSLLFMLSTAVSNGNVLAKRLSMPSRSRVLFYLEINPVLLSSSFSLDRRSYSTAELILQPGWTQNR